MPNTVTLELPEKGVHVAGLENGLPLHGITVLAVEDSRFACDAMRLMCRRLGARLRRADSLQMAAAHLRLYRPDVVIVDLGLPDGRGEDLIRDLAERRPRPVVLAISGDPARRAAALQAGAEGFLDKPLESLAQLGEALLRHLPDREAGPQPLDPDPSLVPDALALRDDLAHASALLEAELARVSPASAGGGRLGGASLDYLAGFVRGVARHAHDKALAEAEGMEEILRLLQDRLKGPDHAFDRSA